jgi:hypothetical protein
VDPPAGADGLRLEPVLGRTVPGTSAAGALAEAEPLGALIFALVAGSVWAAVAGTR